MNIADLIVIGILLFIVGFIVYVTRPKKGKDACSSCHENCASCHDFSNLYKEYKDDQKHKK